MHLNNNHQLKEILHLVLKLTRPDLKQVKFTVTDFKNMLLSDSSNLSNLLTNVSYSQISSSNYREVLKRKKLWKIGE